MKLDLLSKLPCGCPSVGSAVVTVDGVKPRGVVHADTDAGLVVALEYERGDRLRIVGKGARRKPATLEIRGRVGIRCKTHGEQR